jgi:hypothetical protein
MLDWPALERAGMKEWGYPPSGQEAATQTVLQQAELLCAGWT